VKIQIEVFWVVTLHFVVVEYQHFGGPFCLHILDMEAAGSSETLVSNCKQYTLS